MTSKRFPFPYKLIPSMDVKAVPATGNEFMYLIDLLMEEWIKNGCDKGFYNNRGTLAEHLRDGTFYVLRFDFDTYRDFFERDYRDHDDEIFHAFCTTNSGRNNEVIAEMIWVSEEMRQMGIGRKFVEQLNITKAIGVLEKALPFWKAVNVAKDRIY